MSPSRTLLSAEHPAWVGLDAAKRARLRPAPQTPVADLLRAGQRLSAQAAALQRALRPGPGAGS